MQNNENTPSENKSEYLKKNKKTKKKKKKTVYIDDGSTLYDMSGVRGGIFQPGNHEERRYYRSRFLDSMRTYFDSVRFLLLPMLAVIGMIALLFLILWIAMGGLQTLF